mgnify:CR=1 FL=1
MSTTTTTDSGLAQVEQALDALLAEFDPKKVAERRAKIMERGRKQ